jgi:hypothetical protein
MRAAARRRRATNDPVRVGTPVPARTVVRTAAGGPG